MKHIKCVCYYLCFCSRYIRAIETALLKGILCFTDRLLRVVAVMCLASVQYLDVCKCQNHSLQDVFKLMSINIWSCFPRMSKQTLEVMLPPLHATRHMCVMARTDPAALQVYLVSRRPVNFTDCLNVLEKRNICCLCLESKQNTRSPILYPVHCTNFLSP